jgi:hypothetical protein
MFFSVEWSLFQGLPRLSQGSRLGQSQIDREPKNSAGGAGGDFSLGWDQLGLARLGGLNRVRITPVEAFGQHFFGRKCCRSATGDLIQHGLSDTLEQAKIALAVEICALGGGLGMGWRTARPPDGG